ncbi:MAG: DUF5675 family protein [Nonlabens sp.]
MDLTLKRSYFEKGTNGALFINGRFICFTIELPWLENQRNVSCILEGTYEVVPRVSKRFRNHLHVLDVPGRSLILIHPANDAAKELRGCLSPVSQLSGIGTGWSSRAALQKLLSLCYQAYDRKEKVTLTIKS